MYTERSRLLLHEVSTDLKCHVGSQMCTRAAVWQTKKCTWAKARMDSAELTRGNVAHVDIAEDVLQGVAGSCG